MLKYFAQCIKVIQNIVNTAVTLNSYKYQSKPSSTILICTAPPDYINYTARHKYKGNGRGQ